VLEQLPHERLFLADYGYDLRPYFVAARTFDCDQFCFLNSFSVILDALWLSKLHRYAALEDVGLVGATGSYQSHIEGRIKEIHKRIAKPRPWLRKVYFNLVTRPRLMLRKSKQERAYPRFPNPHIRTNAFMSKRTLFASLARPILTKHQAYRFESGWDGMTKSILAKGLRALVVGKDGRAYELEEWHQSRTFWSHDQENLLVRDNQTYKYDTADDDLKERLQTVAWGSRPMPQPPLPPPARAGESPADKNSPKASACP